MVVATYIANEVLTCSPISLLSYFILKLAVVNEAIERDEYDVGITNDNVPNEKPIEPPLPPENE